jgi:predicted transcriptional regulator
MTELTISVDQQLVDRAERVANRRNASLHALVRRYVEQLAAEDEESPWVTVSELERTFRELRRPMGGIDWTSREELHER